MGLPDMTIGKVCLFVAAFLAACAPSHHDQVTSHQHEVTSYALSHWDWCLSPYQTSQCMHVRMDDGLYVMGNPSRIGDEHDVWDTKGVVVDAINLETD